MAKLSESRQALLTTVATRMKELTSLSVIYSQQMASRLGINITDLECLRLVGLGSGLTAGAIAAATGLTTGATTTVIDRLERAGFAQRKSDESDRRRVLVVPTSVARRRGKASGAPMRKLITDVLSRYEDEKLAFLAQVLAELCDAAKSFINSTRESKQAEQKPRTSRGRSRGM